MPNYFEYFCYRSRFSAREVKHQRRGLVDPQPDFSHDPQLDLEEFRRRLELVPELAALPISNLEFRRRRPNSILGGTRRSADV